MAASARCLLVLLIIVVATVVLAAPAAGAAPAVATAPAPAPPSSYRPPVDAPVRDPYRAPIGPYGAGNRGIEYDTPPGTPVVASADGVVDFAGIVAGDQWVTLRHADGLRTTVGPMAMIEVTPAQAVRAGDVLGTAAGPLLFTVRRGDDYIDPATVLTTTVPRVHLAPTVDPEQRLFPASGGWLGPNLVDGLVDVVQRVQRLPIPALALDELPMAAVAGAAEWWSRQGDCSSPLILPPPSLGQDRVAVLVGGLGSTSDSAGIDHLDLASLGYAADATVRFSYRGGRVPATGGGGPLASIPASTYAAADTLGALESAGHQLAELLRAVVAHSDGSAAIDVFAHSQGGIVLRLALAELQASSPDVLNRIATAVTMATPHHGAPLAADVAAIDALPGADPALDGASDALGLDIDAGSAAVAELSPASALMQRLATMPPPPSLRFVSVAARADVVVPAPRAHLDGATNVIVPVGGPFGFDDHGDLPGSTAGRREVALAVAGRPPACRSLPEAVGDHVIGAAIDIVERGGVG